MVEARKERAVKHKSKAKRQSNPNPGPATLESLAEPTTQELVEPTPEELVEVEKEASRELPATLTRVQQLEKEKLEAYKLRDDIRLKIRSGEGDMGVSVALAGDLVQADNKVKAFEASLNTARFDEFQDDLLRGILALIDNLPIQIRKLYFEVVTTEVGGVTSSRPMVAVNEGIAMFGKRVKASGTSSGKVSCWKNKVTGGVRSAKEVYQDIGNHELDGTAKAGAWGRVLDGLHKKGVALDWEVA